MGDFNDEILPEEEISKKKSGKINRQRNLRQYKNLSDEEFNEKMANKSLGLEVSQAFEQKIAKKLQEFEQDYDLSDLKINDKDALRALIQAQISLEEYEQKMYVLRSLDLSEDLMYRIEKLSKVMSELRSDISKFQSDLNITRKVRNSDRDVSVMAYLSNLQQQAKKFYENKMSYIFCEKCNMLLGTLWTLYPEEDRNKIGLVCNRPLEDGTKCGHKTVIDTKTLLSNRGTNKKEITPESML